jgi:antitoxin (DNA-binding transcriptional repressor) of toxin-antitoxin stability system
MQREIGIAALKAHLSETLRTVEQGVSVVVLDRRRPVATIVPFAQEKQRKVSLRITPASRSHKTFKSGEVIQTVDPVDALLLERRERT